MTVVDVAWAGRARLVSVGACAAVAAALAACGAGSPTAPPPRAKTSSSSSRTTRSATTASSTSSRIDADVAVAKRVYGNEVHGWKLSQQLARIASDSVLLAALARGERRGAQRECDRQLHAPVEHYAHITRISVLRGGHVLVNSTLNPDGVFVVAPGSTVLRSRGRVLGTVLLSLQDVTGFVKLTHRLTGAEILARGSSGHVRTSLPAAAGVKLPASGRVTIRGVSYQVRSFGETIWGGEALTVWILARG